MDKARAGAVELEYDARGEGEPVVLIHGAAVADAFVPLMGQSALAGYRLIRYRRRGAGGSTKTPGPVSIADQAADCVGLLDALGIDRAHVVGHSYGGSIALQMALDAPSRVATLSLLEAGMFSVPAMAELSAGLPPVFEAFGSGDKAKAIELFFDVVGGPGALGVVEAAVPGATAQAAADCDFLFGPEFEAIGSWTCGPDELARIACPTLFVLGSASGAFFEQGRDLVMSSVPGAVEAVLPGLNHLLQIQDAAPVASAIGSFLARNPIGVGASSATS